MKAEATRHQEERQARAMPSPIPGKKDRERRFPWEKRGKKESWRPWEAPQKGLSQETIIREGGGSRADHQNERENEEIRAALRPHPD